ncbi:MAG: carboxypeptidase regulatory-like domain-containing protein [Elusimicrobia bacterium]|nr:carboxypeptidase regulatory-like domain-containing protein [Elusimicrobiota bacterium]
MIRHSRGVTLVELLVAVSLLSVGILSFFGAFQFITKSISVSRSRTLAANLAQEKVESLKNYSYYSLLITTSATVDNSFSPPLIYDRIHYPPETIDIGGTNFSRYTFVALAQVDNNVISTISYTYPDTGLKQITVAIAWRQGAETKTWRLNNLLENPNINPLDATISGTVSSAVTHVPIAGALVRTQENPDWNATTDADGHYSFSVYHGSYTIRASSAGWFPQTTPIQNACAGCSLDGVDLELSRISSGSFTGSVWLNPGLVISQVVISTKQSDWNDFQAQYIELFNPTTYTITIGGSPPPIKLYAESNCQNQISCSVPAWGVALVYVNNDVGPGQYYVIANTTSFTAGGSRVTADAYYADDANTHCGNFTSQATRWDLLSTPPKKLLREDTHNISFRLVDSNERIIDQVGYSHNGINPIYCEGACVNLGAVGLADDKQIVRVSSPAAGNTAILGYGRAYDSDDNARDFVHPAIAGYDTILFPPHAAADGAWPVIAGKPGVGAYVAANDTLSGSTRAYAAYVSSGALALPYATYRLDGVSTGTWTVEISSADLFKEISGATSTGGRITGIPYDTTQPPWTLAGNFGARLDSSTLNGFVAGAVAGVSGRPIPGLIVLVGGATAKTTGENGAYFTSTSSGEVAIIVNPNNADPAYVQEIAVPTVYTGIISKQDFTVSQGGVLRGFVTTGTTPLPNVVVTANFEGNQQGAGTSDGTGMFTIRNLSTGTYTIQPSLETGQDASPNSISATLDAAETVEVGTFTIAGAFGSISGRIRDASGASITSGALIVVGASDPPNPPWSVCGSSSPALTPFYTASSKADGTYAMEVRGSTTTTYFLRVYWPSVDLNTGALTLKHNGYSGITVHASAATALDLQLP